MGGATHQLLVADGQVRNFPPAHWHHIEAAVGLPAEDPQRVGGPAVQTAPIGTEEYTPKKRGATSEVRVQGSRSSSNLPDLFYSPDRSCVSFQRANHGELLQVPEFDASKDRDTQRTST